MGQHLPGFCGDLASALWSHSLFKVDPSEILKKVVVSNGFLDHYEILNIYYEILEIVISNKVFLTSLFMNISFKIWQFVDFTAGHFSWQKPVSDKVLKVPETICGPKRSRPMRIPKLRPDTVPAVRQLRLQTRRFPWQVFRRPSRSSHVSQQVDLRRPKQHAQLQRPLLLVQFDEREQEREWFLLRFGADACGEEESVHLLWGEEGTGN